MGKTHLVDPMSAFSEWNIEDDGRVTAMGLTYRELREQQTYNLERDRYCAACGRKIKAGTRVYSVHVSWGRKASQSDNRPIHTEQCIPLFTFFLQEQDGTTHTFATNAFNHGEFQVESVGEPSARTVAEAKAWIESTKGLYEAAYIPVQSYKVCQNGEEILSWDRATEERPIS